MKFGYYFFINFYFQDEVELNLRKHSNPPPKCLTDFISILPPSSISLLPNTTGSFPLTNMQGNFPHFANLNEIIRQIDSLNTEKQINLECKLKFF